MTRFNETSEEFNARLIRASAPGGTLDRPGFRGGARRDAVKIDQYPRPCGCTHPGCAHVEHQASGEGQKGTKLAKFSLLPWSILREVAEHYGRGARKYDLRNWEKGYPWSSSYDALCRHLEAFWDGEEIDDDAALYEPGEEHTARHIIAVVWHALALAFFSRYGRGTDDRPKL